MPSPSSRKANKNRTRKMMNEAARNMSAKLNASMQKRLKNAIDKAAPSGKAANAAKKLLFGNQRGGTRRRR
jgi:hypothetical protein